MVIFRCTNKFAQKFGLKLQRDISEESTTVLGDWYFNFFTHQRINYILALSEKSLLPVIITAKEIKTFPERFGHRLEEILQSIGINQLQIAGEMKEIESKNFGTTQSKVVLSCQNDLIRIVSHILRNDPPANLLEYSLQLSKIPFKSIGYEYPQEVCSRLFEQKSN